MMGERRPTLMLIDGPSIVYRAYFAMMQTPLTTSDGMLVTGIFGFFNIVLRGMQDLKPDYAIVSFDLGKPQFRFDAYPDYKAGRPSMPDDLRLQFPIVRELVAMMGMPIRELEGFEADDVIGTLAGEASRAGIDTYIVSGDLDGLQLVDDHIRLFTTRMGVANTVIYDEEKVAERYGLRPDQMLDYKALKGDTSDNIPGVPGVGEKTAIALLQQFGSLDALYDRLDEVKGKLRERLAEHRESAFLSRHVGRIVTDLPVTLDLESARTGHYDQRAVAQRLRELEFRSLIPRLPPSDVAPTGHDGPERETKGGLQLSLDLLGTRPSGTAANGDGIAPALPRVAPDPLVDPGGAIEHVDPRIPRNEADRVELEAWLAAHGADVGLGWAAGPGRPLERDLLGIALAGADGTSWYLPMAANGDSPWLPRWFARDDRPLIGHDLKQLIVMLAHRGRPLSGPTFDTLMASYMLNAALRAQTLDDLAANHYSAELPRRPAAGEIGEDEAAARRAAAEALISLLVKPVLEAEMAEAGLSDLFNEVEMPLLPVLAGMELAGVQIDGAVLAAMATEFGAQLASLESRIFELVGHPFNIGSPKQLEQILFTELGLVGTKRTRTGFSTDASVLEELKDKHEVVALILEHRQVAKLKSTYVDALPLLLDGDGRVHTTYAQAVAATGRLSSTDPNLQNIPIRTALGRRIRRAFVAPAGEAAARRRLLAGRAAHPGACLGRSRPDRRVRGARGHSPLHRGAGPEARARRRHVRAAVDGQDGQLRRGLRDERLRPGRPAAHPPRGGAPVHRRLLRGLRGDPPLHRRDEDPGARPGIRLDPARPPALHPRALGPQPVAATGGGADGDQHADPGHRGRCHQDRDGAARRRHARTRPAVADAAPGS